jgi:hypothetical protein
MRGHLKRTVIIAMVPVRMMQVSVDKVIGMVAVRNRFMTATRSMLVRRIMSGTAMVRRAAIRVPGAHLNNMLIDMILMRMVKVAVMKIVDVAVVPNGHVATACPMGVRVIGVDRMIVRSHGLSFLCKPESFLVRRVIDGIADEIEKVGIGDRIKKGRAHGSSRGRICFATCPRAGNVITLHY